MHNKSHKDAILSWLKQTTEPQSLSQISQSAAESIPQRTLRRWLNGWSDAGIIRKTGEKRGTRYQSIRDTPQQSTVHSLVFLDAIPPPRHDAVLKQIRDLWTHNSTALEGNTLTLGDTHSILELGLTISGKPLREHQEILGHARAIDILYQLTQNSTDLTSVTKDDIFKLHAAVQQEVIRDIYRPVGVWKQEINGTYAVTSDQRQVYIEYAQPMHVDSLMSSLLEELNQLNLSEIKLNNAASYYAKFHMALVHIHPFFDGNGRIARLIANIPLLRAGLPPLVIATANRAKYIRLLADYQTRMAPLTPMTGLWPDEPGLAPFIQFCAGEYQSTQAIVENASR